MRTMIPFYAPFINELSLSLGAFRAARSVNALSHWFSGSNTHVVLRRWVSMVNVSLTSLLALSVLFSSVYLFSFSKYYFAVSFC